MSTVPLASSYARRLVQSEQRAAGGNIRQAIAAVSRRLRSPTGTIWNLLFRLPKEVSHDLFVALEAAVEREIVKEIGALENELAAVRSGARRLTPGALEEAEASLARLKAVLWGPHE